MFHMSALYWPRSSHRPIKAVRVWCDPLSRPYFHVSWRLTPRGGTDLERRYGVCDPEDPLFTPLLQFARVPFQARVSSQDPFWENLEILAFTASIFTQILAHKPPNLEIFSSQAPFSEANISSQAPHFGNPGRTPLPEKKLVPLPTALPSLAAWACF